MKGIILNFGELNMIQVPTEAIQIRALPERNFPVKVVAFVNTLTKKYKHNH